MKPNNIRSVWEQVEASSLWVSVTARSYHMNREIKHHESNFGVGLEYHFNKDWRAIVGEYDNSYNVHTNYIGGMWMPVDLSHGFRFGMMGVMANGYTNGDPQHYAPAITPMFTYEGDRFGADLMTLVGGLHRGVIGLQVKVKF